MFSQDDFSYAMENTRVVVPPRGLIETFGTTSFQFLLVSELMDQVNAVRVRGGRIEAERPRIVSPQTFHKLLLEGFGEEAREFADWIENQAQHLKILKYGFQLRKSDIRQDVVHDPIEDVLARLEREVKEADDPKSVLLSGVDDAWEVCLLKFTMELIQRSAGENLGEWQRRGLL
ncbi:MAG: hypothetical protein N2322_05920 [Terrimicrobiaceae bacterium]|nr:hypothetical protein [Terrimicrobiaceae bacterium]